MFSNLTAGMKSFKMTTILTVSKMTQNPWLERNELTQQKALEIVNPVKKAVQESELRLQILKLTQIRDWNRPSTDTETGLEFQHVGYVYWLLMHRPVDAIGLRMI